jgi:signal transduction histidine kinase/ligand-binding sensor domain-containing protein/DNA-binding response OmpR family regulator
MKKIILLVLFAIASFRLSAAEPFRHFSTDHGLPTNNVITFTQDHRGFMWVGTIQGTARFDGKRFKTYMHEADGVQHDFVACLYTDKAGNLWEGNPRGMLKYNPQRDRFEHLYWNGGLMGHIYAVREDSKGGLWIGGDKGLYYKDAKDKVIKFSPALAGKHVRALYVDKEDVVWVGTEGGINRIDRGVVKTLLPFPKGAKHDNWVSAIEGDSKGIIWVGMHGKGLVKLDPRSGIFTLGLPVIHPIVRCISPGPEGSLWIGTLGGVTIHTDSEAGYKHLSHNADDPYSLSGNAVYGIFKDSRGSMWVASYFGGINLREAFATPFRILKDGKGLLSNKVISAMVGKDSHKLWIGTDGGGLNLWNRATGEIKQYKHDAQRKGTLSSDWIKSVFQDKEGNLWVGTYAGGINVLDGNSGLFSQFRPNHSTTMIDETTDFAEDHSGHLWVTANSGVTRYKRRGRVLSDSTNMVRPVSGYSTHLMRDGKDRIWVTGTQGIGYFKDGKIFTVDTTRYFNWIIEIKGQVWMGGDGLARYDGAKLHFIRPAFLSGVDVRGILPGTGNDLWLSTNKGLINYHPDLGNYRVYTHIDGLAGNEFNYNSAFKDENGYLYFGGFQGLTYFHPREIKFNTEVAPLEFTQVRSQGKTDSTQFFSLPPERISFSYRQNTITLDFVLLNYIKSDKNQYRYRLNSYDPDWTTTRESSVTYTNLPPGEYVFEVQGANNDGVWTEVKSLPVIIAPPFWKTWWAYLAYALILGALITFIGRYWLLQALFKREEEMHKAKLDFFTYASHEIRTQLTLIMVPLDKLSHELEGQEGPWSAQLSLVKNQTHRLLNLVRELLDFRKADSQKIPLLPRNVEMVGFLREICDSFVETAKLNRVALTVDLPEESVEAVVDPRQLEKVFFNLVSNALKFTAAGDRIDVVLHTHAEDIEVEVRDSGKGIPAHLLPQLFTPFFQSENNGNGYGIGLMLSKGVVDAHGGEMVVKSEEGKGTTVGVRLPRFHLRAVLAPETNLALTSNDKKKGKSTVLVVEDHPELQKILEETLSKDYHVITADNGQKGWEIAQSELPTLVVSDVMMPEMNGFELCERLKSDDRTNHIPVVLLTAKSTTAEQVEGLEKGADLYLTKPFSTHILDLSVRNLLDGKEKMRQRLSRELAFLRLDSTEKRDKEPEILFLQKLTQTILIHLDRQDFNVEKMAKEMGMSVPVLYKKVRAITQMSVNEFVKIQRFRKAAELLTTTEMSVFEVSLAVGFEDRKYFSREFKKHFGVSPNDFTSTEFVNLA